MTRTKIFLLASLLIFFVLCIWFGFKFSPGSYAYAEKYELEYSENDVKKAIHDFKQNNPSYSVPKMNGNRVLELFDEQTKNPPFWYKVYFYYPEENQIVFTWIRSSGDKKVDFALVGINQSLTTGNWKLINKDFSNTENKIQKEKI